MSKNPSDRKRDSHETERDSHKLNDQPRAVQQPARKQEQQKFLSDEDILGLRDSSKRGAGQPPQGRGQGRGKFVSDDDILRKRAA
jgi:hypothetical protein